MIALINGIKIFKDDIHEVNLFAQILKNECEEDFNDSQEQVKETIDAILRIQWA